MEVDPKDLIKRTDEWFHPPPEDCILYHDQLTCSRFPHEQHMDEMRAECQLLLSVTGESGPPFAVMNKVLLTHSCSHSFTSSMVTFLLWL